MPISSEKSFVKKRIINISENIRRFKTMANVPILIFLFPVLVSLDTTFKSEMKVLKLDIMPF